MPRQITITQEQPKGNSAKVQHADEVRDLLKMAIYTSFTSVADLESELLLLWNKFLNRSDLTIDDDFFESGGDSLLAIELLFEVERLTQDTIPPSILFETGTVRQLAKRLTGNVTPHLAVRIGDGKGRLFHFFHGDFNNGGLSVRKLATMLGPDRPMLAIAPHGMDGSRLPASIEEMAAERLPLILEAQSRGPYFLGGHCNGALVAFETSRLLIKAGHTVDLVVMIDPVTVSLRRSGRLFLLALNLAQRAAGFAPDERQNSLDRAWSRLARLERDLRSGRLVGRWKKSWNKQWKGRLGMGRRVARSRGFKGITSPDNTASAKRDRESERTRAYVRVLSAYYPSRLEVPILYVALSHSGRGWRRISPEIEVIDVPGLHKPMAAIVERVRARLDALDAPSELAPYRAVHGLVAAEPFI